MLLRLTMNVIFRLLVKCMRREKIYNITVSFKLFCLFFLTMLNIIHYFLLFIFFGQLISIFQYQFFGSLYIILSLSFFYLNYYFFYKELTPCFVRANFSILQKYIFVFFFDFGKIPILGLIFFTFPGIAPRFTWSYGCQSQLLQLQVYSILQKRMKNYSSRLCGLSNTQVNNNNFFMQSTQMISVEQSKVLKK